MGRELAYSAAGPLIFPRLCGLKGKTRLKEARLARLIYSAFPQLSRHAVEDPRVGEGCGLLGHPSLTSAGEPQHFLNFFLLPQGHGALRHTLTVRTTSPGGGASLAAGRTGSCRSRLASL
jgi:hypothetical protein